MTSPPQPIEASIREAVARGDLQGAADALQKWLDDADAAPTAALFLQLAGFRRALRQPALALASVYQALALDPFDFVALVMRASLLEKREDPKAGQAWAEALAQRPPGALPPPLTAADEAGERISAAWTANRERVLADATAPAEGRASADERARIERFRSNIVRRTRVYHSSPTHFAYPGLAEREFHPRASFPWIEELEATTGAIQRELQQLVASQRAEMVPYVQYQRHEALAQWRSLNHNLDWTALHLTRQGIPVAAHVEACPATMAALDRCGQPQIAGASPNAMFSLLAPRTEIPPHVGVNNARLVCHLPLIVPEGCWFRVGAETRYWREGEAFVFDDTIEHEAANPSGELRVVLIFDVWHPDLGPTEREAVAAAIASQGLEDQAL